MSVCELPKKDVYVVNKDNPVAWSLVRKLCQNYHAGAVIPVTQEEFEALRDDVIRIELPPTERSAV